MGNLEPEKAGFMEEMEGFMINLETTEGSDSILGIRWWLAHG